MGKMSNYALAVTLEERDVQKLTAQQRSLAAIGEDLLVKAARGGIMLPPEYAVRIQEAVGADPQAITEAVERSINREGEAVLVPWRIDPTQVAFYQQQADSVGISLEMQLKSHMDHAFGQGWLGTSAPDAFKILLTPEQYRSLQETFQSDVVTGEDVMERLAVNAPPFDMDDDPVMQSLSGGKK